MIDERGDWDSSQTNRELAERKGKPDRKVSKQSLIGPKVERRSSGKCSGSPDRRPDIAQARASRKWVRKRPRDRQQGPHSQGRAERLGQADWETEGRLLEKRANARRKPSGLSELTRQPRETEAKGSEGIVRAAARSG